MDSIKDRLLAKRADTASGMPEETVSIDGIGDVVVRGLSRDETMDLGKIEDHKQRDFHMLAIGMVEPRMSVSEIRAWAHVATGGEIEDVSRTIGRLSRLLPGAAREVYEEFEGDPESEFRVPPSAEDGPDGSRTAADAE